jgi:subfamily B ATP-binding cassette protein MsbA
VSLVRASVTDAVVSMFQDSTRLIGLTVVAFYMDWVLALCAVCLFPIAGLPIRYFSTALRQNSRRQQEAVGRLNAYLHENVQGNRVVKAFGQERYEQKRLADASERLFVLFLRGSRIRSLPIHRDPRRHRGRGHRLVRRHERHRRHADAGRVPGLRDHALPPLRARSSGW